VKVRFGVRIAETYSTEGDGTILGIHERSKGNRKRGKGSSIVCKTYEDAECCAVQCGVQRSALVQ
jgi:hypothetical protein